MIVPPLFCYLHSDQFATRHCRECARPVCDACMQFEGASKVFCPGCLKNKNKNSSRMKVLIAASICILAIASFGVMKLIKEPALYKKSALLTFDERWEMEISKMDQNLRQYPCNVHLAQNLAAALGQAGKYRESIQVVDQFIPNCGASEDLQAIKAQVYFLMREYEKSIQELDQLLAKHPGHSPYLHLRENAVSMQLAREAR